MSLYSNNNPETTIKGFGYKDKKTALETIKKVEKTKRGELYKFQVINTMYNRAKYHKYRTKDMEEAMKVFNKWLKKFINKRKKI